MSHHVPHPACYGFRSRFGTGSMLGDLVFIGTGTVLGKLFYDHFFSPDAPSDRGARSTFRPSAAQMGEQANVRAPHCGGHRWGRPGVASSSRIPTDVVEVRACYAARAGKRVATRVELAQHWSEHCQLQCFAATRLRPCRLYVLHVLSLTLLSAQHCFQAPALPGLKVTCLRRAMHACMHASPCSTRRASCHASHAYTDCAWCTARWAACV